MDGTGGAHPSRHQERDDGEQREGPTTAYRGAAVGSGAFEHRHRHVSWRIRSTTVDLTHHSMKEST